MAEYPPINNNPSAQREPAFVEPLTDKQYDDALKVTGKTSTKKPEFEDPLVEVIDDEDPLVEVLGGKGLVNSTIPKETLEKWEERAKQQYTRSPEAIDLLYGPTGLIELSRKNLELNKNKSPQEPSYHDILGGFIEEELIKAVQNYYGKTPIDFDEHKEIELIEQRDANSCLPLAMYLILHKLLPQEELHKLPFTTFKDLQKQFAQFINAGQPILADADILEYMKLDTTAEFINGLAKEYSLPIYAEMPPFDPLRIPAEIEKEGTYAIAHNPNYDPPHVEIFEGITNEPEGGLAIVVGDTLSGLTTEEPFQRVYRTYLKHFFNPVFIHKINKTHQE